MINLSKTLKSYVKNLKGQKGTVYGYIVLDVFLIVFQFFYIFSRLKYVNSEIPFWYTNAWGAGQLVGKHYLYLFPALSCFIVGAGLFLEVLFKKTFVRYLKELIAFCSTVSVLLFTYALIKIILAASVPFPPFINPLYVGLALPFFVAFFVTYFLTPFFINYAKDNDLVTNPQIHYHPAMILQKASARGGGFLYGMIFTVLSLVFVGITKNLLGFYISLVLLALLGIFDDFQNTHQKSNFRVLEKPWLRLLLLFSAISFVVISGISINTISNPFDGIIDFTALKFSINNHVYVLVPAIFTLFWIVWVLNLLSWSNGIDGQYGGIIGVTSIFIALLALRFPTLLPIHRQVAVMAAISAGIAFGFTKYTWFPSKIMWGFGAMCAGLVVASLSILINTKIVISILILLIPFFDAVVTVFRRIFQGKNPLRGDRGHLHHLLLDRGWSVQKIALFYWITTVLFGFIGMVSSEQYVIQVVLTLSGLVAFGIILLNVIALREK